MISRKVRSLVNAAFIHELSNEKVSLHEAMNRLLELLSTNLLTEDILEAEMLSIYVYDRQKKKLWSKYNTQNKSYDVICNTYSGIVGKTFSTRKIIRCDDPMHSQSYNRIVDFKGIDSLDSLLSCPVLYQGKAVGVIQVGNRLVTLEKEQYSTSDYESIEDTHVKHSTYFSEEDESTMSIVTSSVGRLFRKKLDQEARAVSMEKRNKSQNSGMSDALDLLNLLNTKLQITENEVDDDDDQAQEGLLTRRKSQLRKSGLNGLNSVGYTEVDKIRAAIKLQSEMRGYLCRKKDLIFYMKIRKQQLEFKRNWKAIKIQAQVRRFILQAKYRRQQQARYTINKNITLIRGRSKRQVDAYNARKKWEIAVRETNDENRFQVVKIQKTYRGHHTRVRLQQEYGSKNPGRAICKAIKIQAVYRGALTRKIILPPLRRFRSPYVFSHCTRVRIIGDYEKLETLRPANCLDCSESLRGAYIAANKGFINHQGVNSIFDSYRIGRKKHSNNLQQHYKMLPSIKKGHRSIKESKLPFDGLGFFESRRIIGKNYTTPQPPCSKLKFKSRHELRKIDNNNNDKSKGSQTFVTKKYPSYRTNALKDILRMAHPQVKFPVIDHTPRPLRTNATFIMNSGLVEEKKEALQVALVELYAITETKKTKVEPQIKKSLHSIGSFERLEN